MAPHKLENDDFNLDVCERVDAAYGLYFV